MDGGPLRHPSTRHPRSLPAPAPFDLTEVPGAFAQIFKSSVKLNKILLFGDLCGVSEMTPPLE